MGFGAQLTVILIAALIFLGCAVSPPGLMDDVDAVQAQIARNMLDSGDWVTARLNGVPYLEKSPLKYWAMAVSYMVFGVHDWAARLPLALSAVLLCWVTARFGAWAFGARAGMWAGIVLATSVGLFLFTRILIPDVMLTLAITAALWGFLRALEERPAWIYLFWACAGIGLLLKGLIAVVFPFAAAGLYLLATRRLWSRETWRRLHPFSGLLLMLAIAAPWHVIATLRNPPYLDFTMRSEPGRYRGFFWFYFLNEHVLRFLNLRHPRDYNTVPRIQFWLFHLLWLFPWSVYFPALTRLRYRGPDLGSRARLLALCHIGFVLAFFTFSTTQEYYSMPIYPALALLIGSALERDGRLATIGTRVAGVIAGVALAAVTAILVAIHGIPAPGDISRALTQNPDAYTLSLGHMRDLTIQAFAYLRLPLAVAGVALLIGAAGAWLRDRQHAWFALAAMMVMFFHAARLALVVFDPYMGSRPLAKALLRLPLGRLIVDDQYYSFSSVFFYAGERFTERPLLLNGRVNNLEYGSYAPGAPDVFLDDAGLVRLWNTEKRYYLVANGPAVPRLEGLVGRERLRIAAASGGKFLFVNRSADGMLLSGGGR
jgi:4-amino-4-deoxy-L-arabinose transferase-like glycosyltransferase